MRHGLLHGLTALTVLGGVTYVQCEVSDLREAAADAQEIRQIARQDAEERVLVAQRETRIHVLEARLQELTARCTELDEQSHEAEELRRELAEAREAARRLEAKWEPRLQEAETLATEFREEFRRQGLREASLRRETETRLDELSREVTPDPDQLSDTLLMPTVQLSGSETVGAGTIVYSKFDRATGKGETYVLTAFHVVRNIFADSPETRRDGIDIIIYRKDGTRSTVKAELVRHDRGLDTALMQLQTDEVFEHVASVASDRTIGSAGVWDEITAVGCPLGNDPIATHGTLGRTDNRVNGTDYWLITAPTYYGNSGGGIYLSDSRELAGVFSKIYTHGRGMQVAVPHLGLCTPMNLIRDWLTEEGLEWVLEPHPGAVFATPPK
ncbi:MAG: trypsin-like peptidase domain-containing protein [Planctomycetota bacterium]